MEQFKKYKPYHRSQQNEDIVLHSSAKEQLIYGIRPVMEAIDAGRHIDVVYIQNGQESELMSQLKQKLSEAHIPCRAVPQEKLNKLVRGNHQGVIATISPIVYSLIEPLISQWIEQGKCPLMVMPDHVTDVRNLGAIARTAECVGVDALILPANGSAKINEDAVKTSAGALLNMTVCRVDNVKSFLNLCRQLGVQIVVATEKTNKNYLTIDYTKPTLLVVGAEDRGVSPEVLKLSTEQASLPMIGKTGSLNVSVATAVFLYEALRQRQA